MDLVGKTLGNYEIVAEIGSGGMSTVYRGNQPSLSRQVAVKVLAAELTRDKTFRERFLREARAIAQLSHPNILPVYDSGEDAQTGALYFVMQLVEDGTLAQRMGQPMEIQAAVRITAQIARALDYAHKRGLVHRDVKPANVLLTPDGHPLLTDFGIARMMEETHLTQTGVSLGTPAYMSPEQAQGGVVDQRTDIYALGVMAYEMLSGKLPFQADTPVGLLHQHAYMAPPPLRTLRPDLPKPLEKVVMRALAKDPAQRYASSAEFADALEEALSGRWHLPVSLPMRAPRPARTQKVEANLNVLAAPGDQAHAPTARAPSTPPGQPALGPRTRAVADRVGYGLLGVVRWALRTVLTVAIILILVAVGLLILASVVGGMLAQQTIEHQDWKLDEVVIGQRYTYYRSTFESGVQLAIEPYTLDSLTDVSVAFEPPDKIIFNGNFKGAAVSLQIRYRDRGGIPNVQVERFNNIPLYVIGGILSDRINSGLNQQWKDAPIRIDTMEMNEDSIIAVYKRP